MKVVNRRYHSGAKCVYFVFLCLTGITMWLSIVKKTWNKYFLNRKAILMIDKGLGHIATIKQHSYKTLDAVRGTKENPLEIFLLLMLDRLHNNSKALELLLNDYIKHPTHDFSIGILLRSALLDTIISINLFHVIEENNGKAENEIREQLDANAEQYLSDGFRHIIGNVDGDLGKGFISGDEAKDFYNGLVAKYPNFFEEYQYDGSKPKVRHGKVQQGTLNETIKSSPTLKNLSGIVNTYEFYSKYDHFTLIHYEMIRQDRKIREARITASIEHLVFHSMILHTLIREVYPGDFFIEQSNWIAGYAEQKIISERTGK